METPLYHDADTVRAFPHDGNQYETVYGELLVTPAPSVWNQEIVARLFEIFRDFTRAHDVGHTLMAPADISWSGDTLVQPDIFVAQLDQVRTLDWGRITNLSLVIEVLSPASARYDRFTKRRLYQDVRIPEYWVVDPDSHSVEVWKPETAFPEVEHTSVSWHPESAITPLNVLLGVLFQPL